MAAGWPGLELAMTPSDLLGAVVQVAAACAIVWMASLVWT